MYQTQSMDDMIGMAFGFPGTYDFLLEDTGNRL